MAYLGIDVGGTNTKVALVDVMGQVLATNEVPTRPDGSLGPVIVAIMEATQGLLRDADKVGLALPGIVDDESGQAIFVPNLGWFEPMSVANTVEMLVGHRPTLANDAVCAAVGEAHYGAGRGLSSFLMLTLGTAVGAAMVVDGRPLDAYGRFGGELGHIPLVHGGLPCSCGIEGCFQQYGSATALLRMAKEAGLEVEVASEVFSLAEQGDEHAAAVADEFCGYVAEGAAGLTNIFRPEAVILAGGAARAGEPLRALVEEKLFERTYASAILGAPQVLLAEEPAGAGALGAAIVGRRY